MLLRARVVLPITRTPIEDGAVLVRGNRIIDFGPWTEVSPRAAEATVFDLGNSILLPGLVNAHCHLDYTDMAGHLPPQKKFTDWIKLITTEKADWSYSEFAESWLHGAKMLLRTGTTTVADFEAVPELLPEVWTATPLRVISFLELTGVKSRRNPRGILREALERIESLSHARSTARLAPHAPYSTVPELIKLAAETARRREWPLSIHVAESDLEFKMFSRAAGDLHDWLKRNDRDTSDCGRVTPVKHLDRQNALGPNLLAVHVNYLGSKDTALLRKNKVNIAHCPRSHFYFKHRKFPYRKLSRAGINVCLGTDSLATVYKKHRQNVELNLFDEMRAFAAKNRHVSAKKILQMATINGARALGLAGQIGEISAGALADLVAIPFRGRIESVHHSVINHRGEVKASMIGGSWAVAPK